VKVSVTELLPEVVDEIVVAQVQGHCVTVLFSEQSTALVRQKLASLLQEVSRRTPSPSSSAKSGSAAAPPSFRRLMARMRERTKKLGRTRWCRLRPAEKKLPPLIGA
jgi:hypothetical protein